MSPSMDVELLCMCGRAYAGLTNRWYAEVVILFPRPRREDVHEVADVKFSEVVLCEKKKQRLNPLLCFD